MAWSTVQDSASATRVGTTAQNGTTEAGHESFYSPGDPESGLPGATLAPGGKRAECPAIAGSAQGSGTRCLTRRLGSSGVSGVTVWPIRGRGARASGSHAPQLEKTATPTESIGLDVDGTT
jgi:hypothetical protein